MDNQISHSHYLLICCDAVSFVKASKKQINTASQKLHRGKVPQEVQAHIHLVSGATSSLYGLIMLK